jgi:hypothetical protein
MFETLLSRIWIRERLKLPSYTLSSTPFNATGLEPGSIPASKGDGIELETLE